MGFLSGHLIGCGVPRIGLCNVRDGWTLDCLNAHFYLVNHTEHRSILATPKAMVIRGNTGHVMYP
jgi:hypothetical protein